METVSLILSLISFVTSVIIAIYEIVENRKLNSVSLESEYFDSLFKDFLLNKIPLTRSTIKFDMNSKLVGTEEFINVLKDMRHNSLYFQYTDVSFFDELKKALFDLEDYILNSENKEITGEEQTEFFNEVQKKIVVIYKILLNKYKGKKTKKLSMKNMLHK